MLLLYYGGLRKPVAIYSATIAYSANTLYSLGTVFLSPVSFSAWSECLSLTINFVVEL